MATFLEIKQLLKDIFCIETDIDENCDITVPNPRGEGAMVLTNNELKEAFDSVQYFRREKLEICTNTYREVSIRVSGPYLRWLIGPDKINDTINGLTYSVGEASTAYCLFLLDSIAEHIKNGNRRIRIDLKHRSRMALSRFFSDDAMNPVSLLPEIVRVYTIKVESNKQVSINCLRSYSSAFEFLLMYKQGIAISEYSDIQDMFSVGNSVLQRSREPVDTPPQRIFNADVLSYYTMALESRDPFTMYISFYHVIEHYFDAVFRKKLTEQIKEQITNPDFSYKNEEKLYNLAKYIKKHMNSDGNSGKGDEFESLRYVLMEYVPVDELKNRIDALDQTAKDYYQNNFVPFTVSTKTKISWSNLDGVYTNLATRIYETRNSLVHSKSEQIANQYRPYENTKDLLREIALIESVAELVLINSSEIL